MPNIKDVVLHHTVMSDEVVSYVRGYLIYLRKSRQDDPNETVEEVLSKHETILQEFALRELGGVIPEDNIYREVVSGESIEDRIEIKKVLSRIEDSDIIGVLVVEPQRLSRGDLGDCDKLIKSFQYTDTLVVTPMMTYDMKKKMERRFFQDELLRGRDYLEYTKEILARGRVAAVKRGCYISGNPPFGYDRIRIGKDWTLEPNDDADTVRLIFDLFVKKGFTPGAIARHLTELGYTPKKGGEWKRDNVRKILSNIHYIGKVRYNHIKATTVVENGEHVVKHLKQPEADVIIAEGKHPGIVDPEIYDAAQNSLSSNPRIKDMYDQVNVFAGILRCAKCGRVMVYDRYLRRYGNSRYQCPLHPRCYKSANADELQQLIITTLESVELPNLQAKLENGDGNAATIQKRRIEKLVKQMEEYRQQEDKQYDLLETGQYTQELFDRRNRALREKMDTCEKEIHMAREAMPKNIDYGEKIVELKNAIEALRDTDRPLDARNRLLRNIVEQIDYSATDHGFGKTDIHLDVRLKLS